MKPNAAQPKAPESKPGSKPNAKDDLKSLPLAEVEKKLGVVAGRPHSSRGAETADPIWAERD